MQVEKEPLISIIIPIYNVEAYLTKCIASVVRQIYSNIEIILVDDGSPDNCGKICDAWAEKDSRIVVIHKKNGGLSDARNVGVAKASGKYVTFVDSDDYISSDYVEYLWTLLNENDADVSCGNVASVYDQKENFLNHGKEKIQCFDNVQTCCEMLKFKSIQMTVAWAKLYKRCLLEQNPFPIGRYHEDEAVMYKIFYESSKTVVGNKKIYGYYQGNTSSITKSRNTKKVNDAIQALEERLDFFRQHQEYELYRMSLRPYLVLLVNEAAEGNRECQRKLEDYSLHDVLLNNGSLKLKSQFLFYKLTGKSLNHILHWEATRSKIERLLNENKYRKKDLL